MPGSGRRRTDQPIAKDGSPSEQFTETDSVVGPSNVIDVRNHEVRVDTS